MKYPRNSVVIASLEMDSTHASSTPTALNAPQTPAESSTMSSPRSSNNSKDSKTTETSAASSRDLNFRLIAPKVTAGDASKSGAPIRPRFNISWDTADKDIATLAGTSIKFAMKEGVLQLLNPTVTPPQQISPPSSRSGNSVLMETEKEEPSIKESNCVACNTVDAADADFKLWRHLKPCIEAECPIRKVEPFPDEPEVEKTITEEDRERKKPGPKPSCLKPPAPTPASETRATRSSARKKGVETVTNSLGFSWPKYLTEHICTVADDRCFQQDSILLFDENKFTVGMRLEAIDPLHPGLYCVVLVKEIVAFRLRLHFLGFPSLYDFWVNADSPYIYPPGWCSLNKKHLAPPRKGKSEMDGISLLQLHTELSAANASSKQLFRNSQNLYDEKGGLYVSHEFRVGMKLEAVDVSHSQFICVATVHDILFSRILIHFDGWSDQYDYWVEPWSNLIQPVGYCQNHGIRINVPKGYNPSKFTWLKYLKETSSSAAPASAFVKKRPSSRMPFRVNDRLEAVDPYFPRLIRLAHIVDVKEHVLKLRFDSWEGDSSNDFEVHKDSSEIFPARFCDMNKHPLVHGPSRATKAAIENTSKISCLYKVCLGKGHVDPGLNTHDRYPDCPYKKPPLYRRFPDRFLREDSVTSSSEASREVTDMKLRRDNANVSCATPGCDGKGHVSSRYSRHLTTLTCPNKNRMSTEASTDMSKKGKKKENNCETKLNSFDVYSNGHYSLFESDSYENYEFSMPPALKILDEDYLDSSESITTSLRSTRKRKAKSGNGSTVPEYNFSDSLLDYDLKIPKLDDWANPASPISCRNVPPADSSESIRSEISCLALEIRQELQDQRSGQPTGELLDRMRKTLWPRKRREVFRESIATALEVAEAFDVKVNDIPDMTCTQVQSLAEKLFGSEHEVVRILRQQEVDGHGLILLDLEGFLKYLKLSVGAAVTLDSLVKLARESRNLPPPKLL